MPRLGRSLATVLVAIAVVAVVTTPAAADKPRRAALRELKARMPESARDRTGTFATTSGPNCLNAVLLWHGLTKTPTWTAWRELDRRLQNPRMFRKLRAHEARELGDVVVHRLGPEDTILHGSIVVDADRVWEKASAHVSSPYDVTSYRASARDYDGLVVEHYRRVEPAARPR